MDDSSKGFASPNFAMNFFIKLGEAFRKTSLARREEIRNHTILALQKSFALADELDFSPLNCINCFNLVIFAMVDDLHEKMVEYSRRDGAEKRDEKHGRDSEACNGAPGECVLAVPEADNNEPWI